MRPELNPELKESIFSLMMGYVFISFNFNCNVGNLTLPLIPNIVGWFFFYKALERLAPLQPTLGLLRPSCMVLGVLSLEQFFPALADGVYEALPLISVFSAVVVVYFHFQLLTDLANLIEEEEPSQKLRKARTVMVLSATVAHLAFVIPKGWEWVMTGGLFVYLATVIYVISVLYGLQKDGEDACQDTTL